MSDECNHVNTHTHTYKQRYSGALVFHYHLSDGHLNALCPSLITVSACYLSLSSFTHPYKSSHTLSVSIFRSVITAHTYIFPLSLSFWLVLFCHLLTSLTFTVVPNASLSFLSWYFTPVLSFKCLSGDVFLTKVLKIHLSFCSHVPEK